jgi:hypothetical protein
MLMPIELEKVVGLDELDLLEALEDTKKKKRKI